jgi:hypothetical protein
MKVVFDQAGEFCVHFDVLVTIDHNLRSSLLLCT